MDAILLCMRKRGIRFFSKIAFPSTNIKRFHTKGDFLKLLRIRRNEYDNVLLIAHGSNNAILTTTTDPNRPYTTYISNEDVDAFENDFVFAVSCLTANAFGRCCVENGCIAYLGYQVEFGCLFSSKPGPKSNVPGAVVDSVNTLIKHIFVEELSRAYEEFLKKPISVCVLKERFAFELEKKLVALSEMSANQVDLQYSIKINEHHYSAFAVNLILNILSFLNDILPKLVCIGDENYISSSFIKYRKEAGACSKELTDELEANPYFQQLTQENYKEYLKDLAMK